MSPPPPATELSRWCHQGDLVGSPSLTRVLAFTAASHPSGLRPGKSDFPGAAEGWLPPPWAHQGQGGRGLTEDRRQCRAEGITVRGLCCLLPRRSPGPRARMLLGPHSSMWPRQGGAGRVQPLMLHGGGPLSGQQGPCIQAPGQVRPHGAPGSRTRGSARSQGHTASQGWGGGGVLATGEAGAHTVLPTTGLGHVRSPGRPAQNAGGL